MLPRAVSAGREAKRVQIYSLLCDLSIFLVCARIASFRNRERARVSGPCVGRKCVVVAIGIGPSGARLISLPAFEAMNLWT